MQKWKLHSSARVLRGLAGRGARPRAGQAQGRPGQPPTEGVRLSGVCGLANPGLCWSRGPRVCGAGQGQQGLWVSPQALTHCGRLKGLCQFSPRSFVFPLGTSFPKCSPQIYLQPGLWLLQLLLRTTKQKKQTLFSYFSLLSHICTFRVTKSVLKLKEC